MVKVKTMKKLKLKSKVNYNPGLAALEMFQYDRFHKLTKDTYLYLDPKDDFLHSQCALLCCVTKMNYIDGNLVNLIVFDSKFLTCPKSIKEFFVNHEMGHVINKDHDNPKYKQEKLLRLFGFLPEMEVNADLFAASVMGTDKVKNIIKYLITNSDLPLSTKFELFRRYTRIK